MNLRDFAERYTAAWCSQDAARVAAHYTPAGSLRINDGEPAVGRPAITAVAQSFMTAFPDMQVILDQLIENREHPEYHWTLIGSNTGPGGTGNRVHISGYEVWTLSPDGLIADSQGHFDSDLYQRQLRFDLAP
jgi:predicted NAD/FAD-dependent oxidoreductase